jgi:hypothetical protein
MHEAPQSNTGRSRQKSLISLVAPAMERFNAFDSRWRFTCAAAAEALARELDSVVDDADAGQHGDVWSSLMRRFSR